jgi:hypothetical protein
MNAPTALHEGHKGRDVHEAKLLAFFVIVRFVFIVCSAVGPFSIHSSELWA